MAIFSSRLTGVAPDSDRIAEQLKFGGSTAAAQSMSEEMQRASRDVQTRTAPGTDPTRLRVGAANDAAGQARGAGQQRQGFEQFLRQNIAGRPTAAQTQLRQQTGQAQQFAQAAGRSAGTATGLRQGMRQAGQIGADSTSAMAQLQAQERAQMEQELASSIGTGRELGQQARGQSMAQELTQAQLEQGQNLSDLRNELNMAGLNDAAAASFIDEVLGIEGMTLQAQLEAEKFRLETLAMSPGDRERAAEIRAHSEAKADEAEARVLAADPFSAQNAALEAEMRATYGDDWLEVFRGWTPEQQQAMLDSL